MNVFYLQTEEFEKSPRIMTLQFIWNRSSAKPIGSSFIGTSPELEMALYTIMFLMNEEDVLVKIKVYDVELVCHKHGQGIGTAFPMSKSDWAPFCSWLEGGSFVQVNGQPCIYLALSSCFDCTAAFGVDFVWMEIWIVVWWMKALFYCLLLLSAVGWLVLYKWLIIFLGDIVTHFLAVSIAVLSWVWFVIEMGKALYYWNA